jgi:hypothetical protein
VCTKSSAGRGGDGRPAVESLLIALICLIYAGWGVQKSSIFGDQPVTISAQQHLASEVAAKTGVASCLTDAVYGLLCQWSSSPLQSMLREKGVQKMVD